MDHQISLSATENVYDITLNTQEDLYTIETVETTASFLNAPTLNGNNTFSGNNAFSTLSAQDYQGIEWDDIQSKPSTFPNDEVTNATADAVADTLVKRTGSGWASFNGLTIFDSDGRMAWISLPNGNPDVGTDYYLPLGSGPITLANKAEVLHKDNATDFTINSGGIARITLKTDGNVGIGTTTPTSSFGKCLEINAYGTGSAAITLNTGGKKYSFGATGTGSLGFYDETLGAYRISIDTTGKVGIGTTSPSAKLHTISTTEQLRVGHDASNYFNATVGNTGGVTFGGAGSATDKWTFTGNIVGNGTANRLPNQTATTNDSVITRALLLRELGYDPIPMGLGGTGGTANTSGVSVGNDVVLVLAGTSVVGNNRYTNSTNPLYPVGSGQPMRMKDSKLTLFFDANFNGLVGNDVYLSLGVPSAARLNGVAGWAIRWKNGGDIELQIHNGTTLQTLTVGSVLSGLLVSYVAVWDSGSLSLYRRQSLPYQTPGRYSLLGTLVGTSVPISANSYYMTWVNECVADGSFRSAYITGFRFLRDAVHPIV